MVAKPQERPAAQPRVTTKEPKSLHSFIHEVEERLPGEVVYIAQQVDPAHFDAAAIVSKMYDLKKFPITVFERGLNLRGEVSDVRLVLNAEISQGKTQLALGVPLTMDRTRMGEECYKREERRIKPVVVNRAEAPVKEIVKIGDEADLTEFPIMRHHYMDGGPYLDMASIGKDYETGIYNTSYHRMEVKGPRLTGFYMSPRHMWKIFKGYEERGLDCPVAYVMGHHPAFNMGACYKGPFDVDEYDVIGAYLQEPLRLVASETWGEDFLVPADAEIIVEGVLKAGQRITEAPFGEAPGYLGPQRYVNAARFEVTAITRRRDAYMQSIITPEGDKPWLDLAREAAYLRRCREAVPTVKAVCKGGKHSHYAIYISMKKTAEGEQGRAAAAALTFDHSKIVFIFDEDIDVFNPTEILWAFATRCQPHRDISILRPMMLGNMLDPSLEDEITTSAMIIDCTRPFDKPYSPVSKCPDDALARINLADYVPKQVLDAIPVDRTTYFA